MSRFRMWLANWVYLHVVCPLVPIRGRWKHDVYVVGDRVVTIAAPTTDADPAGGAE